MLIEISVALNKKIYRHKEIQNSIYLMNSIQRIVYT